MNFDREITDLRNICNDRFYYHNFNDKSIFQDVSVVYAIGDLHGDFEFLIYILENQLQIVTYNTELKKYIWNPDKTNTFIVQVGDILDGYRRDIPSKFIDSDYKSKDIEIIDLLLDLDNQAREYDSRIIMLLGNHEVNAMINVIENNPDKYFDYSVQDPHIQKDKLKRFKDNIYDLIDVFLCKHKSFVIINDFIFCHAGMVMEFIVRMLNILKIPPDDFFLNRSNEDKLSLINLICSIFLNTLATTNARISKQLKDDITKLVDQIFGNRVYTDHARTNEEIYNANKQDIDREPIFNLKRATEVFNIKGMVIGHNITYNRRIVNRIDNLYNIDIAASRGFGSKPEKFIPQILEFKFNKPTIRNLDDTFFG